MPKPTILVTNTYFDSAVYAAQSLTRGGYDVVGADFGSLLLGLRSRFCRVQYALSRDSEAALHRDLLAIVERERPAALLPLGTRFVHAAILLRERLEPTTAVNVPDLDDYLRVYQKRRCMAECARLGVPHPDVYSFDEAAERLADEGAQATVVVKPDYDAGGAQGVRYVRDRRALSAAVEACERDYGSVILEDYIPGGAENMRTVVLLFDRHSELTAAFTTRKIRQWPSEGGVTAFSESTDDAELVRQVLPLFRSWRGAAEVELKLDPRDGRSKVIEVNPRFPAYLRFAGVCGLELPRLATELTLGERPAMPSYPGYAAGRAHSCPHAHLSSVGRELRDGAPVWRTLGGAYAEVCRARASLIPLALDPAPVLSRVVTQLLAPGRLKTAFRPETRDLGPVTAEAWTANRPPPSSP